MAPQLIWLCSSDTDVLQDTTTHIYALPCIVVRCIGKQNAACLFLDLFLYFDGPFKMNNLELTFNEPTQGPITTQSIMFNATISRRIVAQRSVNGP